MSRNEADVVFVAAAPGDPGDHLAANDDGARRVGVSHPGVGDLGVPHELPGPRVQGDDVRVVRGAEDLVGVDGDVSLNASSFVASAGAGGASGRYSQIRSPVAASSA